MRTSGPLAGFSGVRTAPGPLPVPTTTAPAIVPLPPNVPALTWTGPVPVAEPTTLSAASLPFSTIVPPVYLFGLERTRVPLPILVSEPLPSIVPENVVSRLLVPTVRLLDPR